jgi:hypothetical protein
MSGGKRMACGAMTINESIIGQAAAPGPMYFISLYIEVLRRSPALMFWGAVVAQAVLWTLVPTVFYAAPPGDVANVLAVGHEFQFGNDFGPPLAFWLAEIAFRIAGSNMLGVYALAQACVIATYWCVFALGSAIVGPSHAAVAVLLMVGISAFTVATPEFGPALLAMTLWALILLHYWRAVGEGRERYWFAVAAEGALLLMTTYYAVILIGLVIVFTLATERGRAIVGSINPWIAAGVVFAALFPHLLWLDSTGDFLMPTLTRLLSAEAADHNLTAWLRQIGTLLVVHAGLGLLILLASGWPLARRDHAGTIARPAVEGFARTYVYFFAVMPAVVSTFLAVLAGWPLPSGSAGMLLVLSGLAVVVAAGDVIIVHYQRIVGLAWVFLLLAPPAMAAAGVALLPWALPGDLRLTQPAVAMGRFFGENFERRTGRPLAVVAGDPRVASLIAYAAPSRPSLYLDATPARTPWVTAESIKEKGAVVVWLATDTIGAPPADIKTRFPDLVPEVPRAFERPFQGVLPLVRVGWAMIRPQAPSAPAQPAAPPSSDTPVAEPSATPAPTAAAPAPTASPTAQAAPPAQAAPKASERPPVAALPAGPVPSSPTTPAEAVPLPRPRPAR